MSAIPDHKSDSIQVKIQAVSENKGTNEEESPYANYNPNTDTNDEPSEWKFFLMICIISIIFFSTTCYYWSIMPKFEIDRYGRVTEETLDRIRKWYLNHGAISLPELQKWHIWRGLTCTLLHADFRHLMNNLIALLVDGMYFNALAGNVWLFIIWILTAIYSGIIGCVFMDKDTVSIGASGAVCGVTGALTMLCILDWNSEEWKKEEINIKNLFGCCLLSIILEMFMAFSGVTLGINHWAHLGGFISGAIIIFGFYGHQWSKVSWKGWMRMIISSLCLIGIAVGSMWMIMNN